MIKVVSVILARGGSKGIPDKNIIDVNGRPLIWHSINASLNSNVEETWVSTDSKKISIISEGYGAMVLDRPSELATDTSQSDDSLVHFASKVDFDILVFIQPTSPMIKSDYINQGINMVINDGYNSVFTGYKNEWNGVWDKNMNPIGWDVYKRPRRQDVEETMIENGMFYITKRKNLLTSKLRYSGNIGCLEIPFYDSFQVDTYEDLDLIRTIINR